MKPIITLLCLAVIPAITSCNDSNALNAQHAQVSEEKLTLSTDELLQLMDGQLFEVITPDDIKPEDFAGLGILKPDGSIQSFSSSNDWKPGERVKIVCYRPNKNSFEYSISRNGSFGQSATNNFPDNSGLIHSGQRRGLVEGQMLMRCSLDESLILSDTPQGDDFDIIFHVQKK